MSKSEDMRRLIDLANNNKIISESYSDNEADPFKAFSSWNNISEAGMPSSVIKSKEKIRYATDEENKQRFAGKTLEELRSMAWRHGYGKDSKEYDKFHDGVTGVSVTEDSDPCWDGYRQLGMKKKNGKKVPNCIPEGTLSEDEYGRDLGALYDRHVYGDDEDEDEEDEYYDYDDEDGIDFMQSGSARRAASHDNPRDQPCPTCDAPNKLTPADVELGYQCDHCADKYERGYD